MAHTLEIDRLVRSQNHQTYWQQRGQWTPNPREAWIFPTELDALEACRDQGLSDVELVLRIRDHDADLFVLPVT